MNGANALVETLADQGVEVCFGNPGTSEMHFLAALENPRIKSVLCLFEGVCTGAADGWARMRRKPASTLLHLGPGLANGLANIHNARRASVPMVNVVGEHSLSHLAFDPPLKSDIEGLARPLSHWVRTIRALPGSRATRRLRSPPRTATRVRSPRLSCRVMSAGVRRAHFSGSPNRRDRQRCHLQTQSMPPPGSCDRANRHWSFWAVTPALALRLNSRASSRPQPAAGSPVNSLPAGSSAGPGG